MDERRWIFEISFGIFFGLIWAWWWAIGKIYEQDEYWEQNPPNWGKNTPKWIVIMGGTRKKHYRYSRHYAATFPKVISISGLIAVLFLFQYSIVRPVFEKGIISVLLAEVSSLCLLSTWFIIKYLAERSLYRCRSDSRA